MGFWDTIVGNTIEDIGGAFGIGAHANPQNMTPGQAANPLAPGGVYAGAVDPSKINADPRMAAMAESAYGQGQNLMGQAGGYQNRQGPMLDQTQANQARLGLMGLANQYGQMAAGQGPSLAQMQLQRATDQNMQQAASMAATTGMGARGAGGLRQLGNQRAAIGQQMAADSGLLRMQEQLAAMNAQGGLLSGIRGQDLGAAQANQAAALQQRGLNDQATLGTQQLGSGLMNSGMTGMGNYSQLNQNGQLSLAKLGSHYDDQMNAAALESRGNRAGLVKGVAGGLASLIPGVGQVLGPAIAGGGSGGLSGLASLFGKK